MAPATVSKDPEDTKEAKETIHSPAFTSARIILPRKANYFCLRFASSMHLKNRIHLFTRHCAAIGPTPEEFYGCYAKAVALSMRAVSNQSVYCASSILAEHYYSAENRVRPLIGGILHSCLMTLRQQTQITLQCSVESLFGSQDRTMSRHQVKNSPSGPATLPALPDVPMRTLLGKIPLQQLVYDIPLVSRRWCRELQPAVLASKRHLVLYIGQNVHQALIVNDDLAIPRAEELLDANGHQLYPSFNRDVNRLQLTTLHPEAVDRLIALMPNIIAFEIAIHIVPLTNLDEVIRLLEQWAPNLKTFKLHCQEMTNFAYKMRSRVQLSASLLRLIEVLNRLPVLEHLTLDVREDLHLAGPLDLSILGRLKEFYFTSHNESPLFLYRSLLEYAQENAQLTAIGLGNTSTITHFLDRFEHTQLAHKFVCLPNLQNFIEMPDEAEHAHFLATFSRLQTYQMPPQLLTNSSLSWLQQSLAPLKSLLYIWWALDDTTILRNPPPTIDPLPSVKLLSLIIRTSDHTELTFPHWGQLFPSIQVLVVVHYHLHHCQICAYDFNRNAINPVLRRRMINCARLLLRPLKQCAKLRKIYYRYTDWEENNVVFERDDL